MTTVTTKRVPKRTSVAQKSLEEAAKKHGFDVLSESKSGTNTVIRLSDARYLGLEVSLTIGLGSTIEWAVFYRGMQIHLARPVRSAVQKSLYDSALEIIREDKATQTMMRESFAGERVLVRAASMGAMSEEQQNNLGAVAIEVSQVLSRYGLEAKNILCLQKARL